MSDDTPPAAKHSLLSMSVSAGGFCEIIALLSLAGTWLGSLGRHHWFLDLMSHLRLQYLVVCAFVMVFALLRRRVWLVVVALVSLLWNAQLVHTVNHTASGPGMEGKPLRLMVFNVMITNRNQFACIEHVLKSDADIVCLLETDETWREGLEPLRMKYAHRVEELGAGAFSIACYSRLPVKSSEIRRFTDWNLPTVLLNLDHHGTPLTFIGTHPLPPMGPMDAQIWRDQLERIGRFAAGIDGEVIVAGDLNATPWCEGMRRLCESGGLQFRSSAPVWLPTWGLHLPTMIPIDHVLLKRGLMVTKRVIGPGLGSDHRSVVVEIVRRN